MEKEKKSINNNLNNNHVKNYVNYLAKINSSENRKEILISKYNTTNKKIQIYIMAMILWCNVIKYKKKYKNYSCYENYKNTYV